MLTVITPTGARPEAFALCKRMIERQTLKGFRWIVVDDGPDAVDAQLSREDIELHVIRPTPLWKHGQNTQGRNLLAALDLAVKLDADPWITVFEDDDWYSPLWLDQLSEEMTFNDLVGEGEAIYYNVAFRKWRRLGNREHASLRCTGIRGSAIEAFFDVLAEPYRYYDMKLWKRVADKRVFFTRLTIGMKALSGRPGIALGHDGVRGTCDPEAMKLRAFIGADADWYLGFYKDETMQEKLIVVKPFRYNKKNWAVGEEFIPVKRIDGELHMHARKVELRAADESPKRTVKVQTQEQKLAKAIVEKAPEPMVVEPEAEEIVVDKPIEPEEEKQEKPEPAWSRKLKSSKDD